jgi:SAM-dependent methyltransferase
MRKAPMTADEIGRRRDEITAHRGPWRMDNLRLGKEVFTMSDGDLGRGAEVRRAVQTIADLASSRFAALRILDLSCGEGGLALELGKQGAEVVALESKAALLEKAEFARDALGLHRVAIVRGDFRRISPEEHGYFDVVVALGVLDRLDAGAVFDVVKRIGGVCKGFALTESRIAARPRASREWEGAVYRGATRVVDGAPAFLLTRPSLLSLWARYGFTSIVESLHPDVEDGPPCYAAFKGRRAALQTAPSVNAVVPRTWAEAKPARRASGLKRLLSRAKK